MANNWLQIEELFNSKLKDLYPAEEIKSLFFLVLEETLHIKKHKYLLHKNDYLAEDNILKIENILKELSEGKPIQHILGKADFYKNVFKVSENTLIPRPETEELVHKIIKDYKDHKHLEILDIGTGTGCIIISLYKNLKDNYYTAIDVSKEAILIAKENATKLNAQINFIEADILEWELIFQDDQKFDIIVSNPPYITQNEKLDMHDNVLNYEPHLALFVEDDAPLLFYNNIADFAKKHLLKNGTLYFEINQYLSTETAEMLYKKGFTSIEIIKDINGADRIIKCKKED